MWCIVLSRSLPGKEADKQSHYEEHRLWLDDQHRAGRLLFLALQMGGSEFISWIESERRRENRSSGSAPSSRYSQDASVGMASASRLPAKRAEYRGSRANCREGLAQRDPLKSQGDTVECQRVRLQAVRQVASRFSKRSWRGKVHVNQSS
jgi:hypothetical protein